MTLNALTIDMRELWKQVRLDAIRNAVHDVVGQLQDFHSSAQPDGPETLPGPNATVGPHRAALQTCCDELRMGCGIAPLHAGPTPPDGTPTDPDYDARSAAALGQYRSRARVALREALGLTAAVQPEAAAAASPCEDA